MQETKWDDAKEQQRTGALMHEFIPWSAMRGIE